MPDHNPDEAAVSAPLRRSVWRTILLLAAAFLFIGGAVALAVWAVMNGWYFLALGLPPVGLAAALWRIPGKRRRWRMLTCAGLFVLGLPPLGLWAYQIACLYGPRPEPTRRMLFQGVEYIREVVDEPHPAVVHIIRVDLTADGVEVLVTPPDFPGRELAFKARTVSTFVDEFGVQVAINAGHFYPFRTSPPWSLYPWPGDPVGVLGGSASRGVLYDEPREHFPAINVTAENHAVIAEHPPQPWYNAVTGKKHFLEDGRGDTASAGQDHRTYPRTLVAIDEAGHTLFLVVVDGEQAPYSAGLGRGPITKILRRYGAHDGLALDGGGSSAMVVEGPNGRSRQLSRPINLRIPGLERPVGTHIGIYAEPLDADETGG